MDLHVELPAITRKEVMAEGGVGESSALVAERVARARGAAALRLAGTPWRTNADVPATVLLRRWPVAAAALGSAATAMDKGLLTARGFGRVQRLAWTLADLCGRPADRGPTSTWRWACGSATAGPGR